MMPGVPGKLPGHAARRCSMCDINWPDHKDYAVCPQCQSHTSPMMRKPQGPVLSEAEAKSKAAHMKFERYLEEESEEDRRKRQENDARTNERVSEAEAAVLKERFAAVIEGAGFTKQERDDIARYEAQLPMAHVNREDDDE